MKAISVATSPEERLIVFGSDCFDYGPFYIRNDARCPLFVAPCRLAVLAETQRMAESALRCLALARRWGWTPLSLLVGVRSASVAPGPAIY